MSATRSIRLFASHLLSSRLTYTLLTAMLMLSVVVSVLAGGRIGPLAPPQGGNCREFSTPGFGYADAYCDPVGTCEHLNIESSGVLGYIAIADGMAYHDFTLGGNVDESKEMKVNLSIDVKGKLSGCNVAGGMFAAIYIVAHVEDLDTGEEWGEDILAEAAGHKILSLLKKYLPYWATVLIPDVDEREYNKTYSASVWVPQQRNHTYRVSFGAEAAAVGIGGTAGISDFETGAYGISWKEATVNCDDRPIQDECATEMALQGSSGVNSYRALRDHVFAESTAGLRYTALYEEHTGEVVQLLASDPKLAAQAATLLRRWRPAVEGLVAAEQGQMERTVVTTQQEVTAQRAAAAIQRKVTARDVVQARALLEALAERGSPELRADLKPVLSQLKGFVGRTPSQIEAMISAPSSGGWRRQPLYGGR